MANTNGQKKGIIRRVQDWWYGLSENQQIGLVCGVWFLDGILYGSYGMKIHKDKQAKEIAAHAAAQGYLMGQSDAYKEIAQNPYKQMEIGMKRLEQQGIAKKF